jgi:hypothetical protein
VNPTQQPLIVNLPLGFRIVAALAMVATVAATVFTGCQLQLARQQMRASSRAWIQFITPEAIIARSVSELQTLESEALSITNPGKSPATAITVEATIELVPADASPSFSYRGGRVTRLAMLFPGAAHSGLRAGRFAGDGSATELTADEIARLAAGKAYLVLYARATYRDAFGTHWTQFCGSSHFGSATFSARRCIDYNRVGDTPNQTN